MKHLDGIKDSPGTYARCDACSMVAIIMRLVRRLGTCVHATRLDPQVAPESHTLIFSYLKHSIFLRPALFVLIQRGENVPGPCHVCSSIKDVNTNEHPLLEPSTAVC